jgi:hypothetical protein
MSDALEQLATETASYIKWAQGSLRQAVRHPLPSEAVADIKEAECILDTLLENIEGIRSGRRRNLDRR